MSNAGPLFRPYDKLVKITLGEKQFEVPDGNMLLRALQFLSPEDVSYGKFCWNEECQYCRVNYDLGPETPNRTAISCKLMVQDGMRITEVAQEIKYCRGDESVEDVAKQMAQLGVRRLPVIDAEKRLVGIVSLSNVTGGGDTHATATLLRGVATPH